MEDYLKSLYGLSNLKEEEDDDIKKYRDMLDKAREIEKFGTLAKGIASIGTPERYASKKDFAGDIFKKMKEGAASDLGMAYKEKEGKRKRLLEDYHLRRGAEKEREEKERYGRREKREERKIDLLEDANKRRPKISPQEVKFQNKVEEDATRYKNVQSSLNKLDKIIDAKGTRTIFGDTQAIIERNIGQLAQDIAKLGDPNNAAMQGEVDFVKENLIKISRLDNKITALKKLDDLRKHMEERRQNKISTWEQLYPEMYSRNKLDIVTSPSIYQKKYFQKEDQDTSPSRLGSPSKSEGLPKSSRGFAPSREDLRSMRSKALKTDVGDTFSHKGKLFEVFIDEDTGKKRFDIVGEYEAGEPAERRFSSNYTW